MRAANPVEIVPRLVERLKRTLRYSDASCFAVDDPYSVNLSSAPDSAIMVAFDGGTFPALDQAAYLAWPDSYLKETAHFSVTIFNRLRAMEEGGRATSLTAETKTNLFRVQRRVLAAFVGWNLNNPGDEPLEIGSLMKATRTDRPYLLQKKEGGGFGWFLTTGFSVDYYANCVDYGD